MAYTKADEFSEDEVSLSEMAKALSHPARIAILKLLAKRETCVCGEIVDQLPLSQSTVSQHLKALKTAGWIQGEIEGPKVCYCLDKTGVSRFAKSVGQLMAKMDRAFDIDKSCC